MRFQLCATAILAMASSALAQVADFNPIFSPKLDQEVPAGSPFVITWKTPAKYANEKVSITLMGGSTALTQVPLTTIASGLTNSVESFTWNVDPAVGENNVFSIRMQLEKDPQVFQFSPAFKIAGAAKLPSSSPLQSPTQSPISAAVSAVAAATTTNTTTRLSIPLGSKSINLLSTGRPLVTSMAPVATTLVKATGGATVSVAVGYQNNTSINTSCRDGLCHNSTTLATKVFATSATRNPPVGTAITTNSPGPVVSLAAAPMVGAGFLGLICALATTLFAL